MKMKSYITIFLIAALLLAVLGGCSAKSEAMAGNSGDRYFDGLYDSASDMVADEAKPEYGLSTAPQMAANQKLVRTMTVEAETDDMDSLLGELTGKINALGGYVENKSTRNGGSTSTRRYRYADMTIRIPADRLSEFIDHISGQTNVLSYQESADDITLRYVATQSRVTALETEQQRLLELLAKAENMTDLLLIEERLTNVRTELEEFTSQMRIFDNMVDYGTIRLSVTEVQEFTPVQDKTVWQKIGSGIADSWRNLCDGAEAVFVFLVVSLPYCIPIGGAVVITVIAVKLANRKTKKRETPPTTESET